MRSLDKELEEASSLPVKVLVCIRLVAERSLMVVGQGAPPKPQPLALIFPTHRAGGNVYADLLESDKAHKAPLELAIDLVHTKASLLLPNQRFVRDGGWVTSEEGKSFWEHLYFADIVEDERNVLLLDLPNRTTFTQMTMEEARSFLYREHHAPLLRLKHSRWFSGQVTQKAA